MNSRPIRRTNFPPPLIKQARMSPPGLGCRIRVQSLQTEHSSYRWQGVACDRPITMYIVGPGPCIMERIPAHNWDKHDEIATVPFWSDTRVQSWRADCSEPRKKACSPPHIVISYKCQDREATFMELAGNYGGGSYPHWAIFLIIYFPD